MTGWDAALLPAVLLADVMIPSQVLATRTFYVHVQARCPAWCKAKKKPLKLDLRESRFECMAGPIARETRVCTGCYL